VLTRSPEIEWIYPTQPRWWWLAVLGGATWVGAAFWIVYRTLAGHPILGSLLGRIGG
jgi:hypothetical protein